MPVEFRQTFRSVERDSPRLAALGTLASVSVMTAWVLWLVFGEVTLYAVSTNARIEVRQAPHPVEAAVYGRLAVVHVELRDRVEAGQVIAELDCELQQLEREQVEARKEKALSELEALRRAIEVTEQGLEFSSAANSTALAVARARKAEAKAAAEVAELEARAADELTRQGVASDLEWARTSSAARQGRSQVRAHALGLRQLRSSGRAEHYDRAAQLEQLRREVVALEGMIREADAEVARLNAAIAGRRIVAAVSGEVGEIGSSRIGTFVEAGERIATIVPEAAGPNELRVVAELTPKEAIGRVRPGQRGGMRLEGFPWLQYGGLPVEVEQVGNEVRDGGVRAELRLLPAPGSAIPVGHGLPGQLRIQVEQVSPWTLLVRSAGELLDRNRTSTSSVAARGASSGSH